MKKEFLMKKITTSIVMFSLGGILFFAGILAKNNVSAPHAAELTTFEDTENVSSDVLPIEILVATNYDKFCDYLGTLSPEQIAELSGISADKGEQYAVLAIQQGVFAEEDLRAFLGN